MNKVERTGIALAIVSILVGVLAWIFPMSEPSKIMIFNNKSQETYKFNDTDSKEQESFPKARETREQNIEPPTIEPHYKRLVTSLSFEAFNDQMRSYLSPSDKLEYAEHTKHLLKKPISFSQLNRLLSQILSESSKIELIRMLRPQLAPPNEEDLAKLQSQFLSSHNKSEALSLIYQ